MTCNMLTKFCFVFSFLQSIFSQIWNPRKKVDLDSLAVFHFGHLFFVQFENMALEICQKTCIKHNAANSDFW